MKRMSQAGSRYHPIREIGEGGMGQVTLVNDLLSNTLVALKRVHVPTNSLRFMSHSNNLSEDGLRLALAREFQTLATLRHPHIISVLDFGFDDLNQPYYTMDYLEDAKSLLEAGENQAGAVKLSLLEQIAHALAYLHRRGVLHRDLKPENVLVANWHLFVLDFGIATSHSEGAAASGGSYAYMAPEIWYEQPYVTASDFWAVGVMAFELFTGKHPFGPVDSFMLDRVLDDEPDWSLLPTGLKTPRKAILKKLLEKKPEDRYQHAGDLLHDINVALGRKVGGESAEIRESFLQSASFVGRDTEIVQLQNALSAAQDAEGSVWLVGGESGVGKSRLLDELRPYALVNGWQVVRGQAVTGGDAGYKLWRDVLPELVIGSAVTDREAGVLQTIVPDIGRILNRPIPSPIPLDPDPANDRLIGTILTLLRRQRRPTLILFEDLQWAQSSINPIRVLLQSVQNHPILVIATYRNDERPQLPHQLPSAKAIQLKRLEDGAIAELTQSILGDAVANQPELVALLQQETEGNAFFVVEVVRALAEEAGRLDDIQQMSLPAHVFTGGMQKIIERRLNRVSAEFQPLLQIAAASGRALDLRLLAHLSPSFSLEHWLTACHDAAVIGIQDNQWSFSHDKLRESLLAQLSTSQQATIYRRLAEETTALYPNDVSQAGKLSDYWQIVGDDEKERYFTIRAGQFSAENYANEDAIRRITRAIDLTPKENIADQIDLLLAREEVLGHLGDRAAQRADLDRIEKILSQVPEQKLPSAFIMRQTELDYVLGHFENAIEKAKFGIELAESEPNGLEQIAKGYNVMVSAFTRFGQYIEAIEVGERGLARLKTTTSNHLAAGLHLTLTDTVRENGDYRVAKTHARQAYEIFSENDDIVGGAQSLAAVADLTRLLGNVVEANELYDQCLPILRKIGDRSIEQRVLRTLGSLALYRQNFSQARQYMEESKKIAEEIENKLATATATNTIAMYHTAIRDYQSSADMYEKAFLLYQDINDQQGMAMAGTNAAGAFSELGQLEKALAYLERAFLLTVEINDMVGQGIIRGSMSNVVESMGQIQLAQTYALEGLATSLKVGNFLMGGVLDSYVHLAEIALVLKESAEATQYIEKFLDYQKTNRIMDGTPQNSELIGRCAVVLHALHHPQYVKTVTLSHELFEERREGLNDAAQQRLLGDPLYQQISSLFEALRASATD